MKRFLKPIYVFAPMIMLLTVTVGCGGKKKKEVKTEGKMPATAMATTIVEFPAADGLLITAELYETDSSAPVVVMCHQARMNKSEYAESAPKVNALGFTCLVIDQRSGGNVDGKDNETFKRAEEKGLATEYLDAEQDIVAAVEYAYARWKRPVILWGSSYSAGLCLKVANENEHVRAAIAFSPGEYYEGKMNLTNAISGLDKPVFVTSTEKEAGGVEKLLAGLPKENVTQYYPETKGTHGSKALWSSDPASEEYWTAVSEWLVKMK